MADSMWDRTWTLFYAALEIESDKRAAFLDSVCGKDDALRREVDELLMNAAASGVLDRSPARAATPPAEPLEGKRIGRYDVRSRIGHGGMGVVYEAEQIEPVRRRVALKVIPAGTHPDAASRFALERQALALMNHPHIARVFDAGVMDDGRPFIAMEHVEGVPLNEYCDRNGLEIAQRLELFILVCQAIQHAHQKGIIHRDIKPSNVLVTMVDGVPTPKVIDFGLAKAVHPIADSEGHHTLLGIVIGTLEYMSPEQLQGAGDIDIDTRSDIYSLGVLLYELLTGVLPYDWDALRKAGLDGLRKITSESEPRRPSHRLREIEADRAARIAAARRTAPQTLSRRLTGDLDWIVLKALDRDRTRRYASASEFADDIRRHLANEPALAGPPSTTYRMAKFVRRHRAAVSVAAAIAILLVGFAGVTAMQSLEIRRALARADVERARAERVALFLTDVFRASDPYEGRGEVTARQVLDRSAQRIGRELNNEPQVKASVLAALGSVYGQLRLYDDAERLIRESLAMRRNLHAGDHLEKAESLEALGRVLLRRTQFPDAARTLEQAVAMKRRLLAPDDARRAEGLFLLGAVRRSDGSLDAAERHLREGLRLTRAAGNLSLSADICDELGNAGVKRGDYAQAEPWYREALALRKKENPDAPRTADTQVRLGAVLVERGDPAAGEPHLREALALLEKHLGPDHEKIAPATNNLAFCLQQRGQLDEAATMYARALSIWRRIHGDKHPGVPLTLMNLGQLAADRDRFAEAEKLFREAQAVQEKRLKPDHPDLAAPINGLARVLHDEGRTAEAESLYREALRIRRKGLKPDHPLLSDTLVWYGKLLTEKKSLKEAESMLREGIAIRTAGFKADDWRIAEARSLLGGCLVAQKRYAEAEPLLVETYPIIEQKRGKNWRRTIQARDRVIALYDAWGRPHEAARHRAKLRPV